MSQKLPVKIFKWVTDVSKIDESFIKCYNEKRDKGSFLEVDDILKIYIVFKTIYPFFPKKKYEKVEKLVANLHGKTEYIIRRRNLKQTWKHGLVLRKAYRIVKINQKTSLKS